MLKKGERQGHRGSPRAEVIAPWLSSVLAALLCTSAFGCGAADNRTYIPAIYKQSATFGPPPHPAVGIFIPYGRHNCTAFLAERSDIIITSAHCCAKKDDTNFSFKIEGDPQSYGVRNIHAFTPLKDMDKSLLDRLDTDIAIIQLDRAVPEHLAKPFALTKAVPADGEDVKTYGYGAGQVVNNTNLGAGEQRSATFHWPNAIHVLTQGDSGGPVLNRSHEVFAVNTGAPPPNGSPEDRFTKIDRHLDDIRKKISSWPPVEQAVPPRVIVTEEPPRGVGSPQAVGGTVTAIIGGAEVVAALGFLGAAAQRWSDASCVKIDERWTCTSEGDLARQSSITYKGAAIGMGVAGGISMGVGLLILLLSPSPKSSSSKSSPLLGRGRTLGSFHF